MKPAARVDNRVSSKMSASVIAKLLVEHGCPDITDQLELKRCGVAPVSGGGFGDIFRGALGSGKRVAIKCPRLYLLQDDDESRRTLKRAARELYTWSRLKHPNILELIGLAQFQHYVAMISPWMSNGTLLEYIKRNPSVDRRQIALGISEGVVYLHQRDAIHGDLKGANVLISGEGVAKLTDFGCTQLKKGTLCFTTTTGGSKFSMRWAAPEILDGSIERSKEADVYALGMELVTGLVPFSETTTEAAVIAAVLLKKQIPQRPKTLPSFEPHEGEIIWGIMEDSWAYRSSERPGSHTIRNHLKDIMANESEHDCTSKYGTDTDSDYESAVSEPLKATLTSAMDFTNPTSIPSRPGGGATTNTSMGVTMTSPLRNGIIKGTGRLTRSKDLATTNNITVNNIEGRDQSTQTNSSSCQPSNRLNVQNHGGASRSNAGARFRSLPASLEPVQNEEAEEQENGSTPLPCRLPPRYDTQQSNQPYSLKFQPTRHQRRWMTTVNKHESWFGLAHGAQQDGTGLNILEDKLWQDTDPELRYAKREEYLSKINWSVGGTGDAHGQEAKLGPAGLRKTALGDSCSKIIQATLQKYKTHDEWQKYAIFICYDKNEQCLTYKDKPMVLFHNLQAENKNPWFTIRHIKNVPSPTVIARRAWESQTCYSQEPDRDSGSITGNFLEGRSDIVYATDKSYAIAIYPYAAKSERESNISVHDAFIIVARTGGWWVVQRDISGFGTLGDAPEHFWVPDGCLLEISLPAAAAISEASGRPVTNYNTVQGGPIMPRRFKTLPNFSGITLTAHHVKDDGELEVDENEAVRVFKRHNFWSYAVRESSGERGWIPSWIIERIYDPSLRGLSLPAEIERTAGLNAAVRE
ncbi:Tyrosine kinase catalytic domain protein [Ceratobasidium sp. AG-Ba]|nr:Tyrosine kinase catalytic domain protein [Ceratobasidium sp. AG-Ba]